MKKVELDDLPHFDEKPEGFYQKYDDYDAINVDFTKDIPIDYPGVMGVPFTAIDNSEIMRHVELLDAVDPHIGGAAKYKRILVRWCYEQQLECLYYGKKMPASTFGVYHVRAQWERAIGIRD